MVVTITRDNGSDVEYLDWIPHNLITQSMCFKIHLLDLCAESQRSNF